jgi:hypothetical protein
VRLQPLRDTRAAATLDIIRLDHCHGLEVIAQHAGSKKSGHASPASALGAQESCGETRLPPATTAMPAKRPSARARPSLSRSPRMVVSRTSRE